MIFGITAFGMLASNFKTRLCAFGTGSAWNGEIEEPLSDFPELWVFSFLHNLALLSRPTRLIALFGILGFHVMIGVLMGLPWFSLTMIAIDAIFIRDRSWQRLGEGFVRRWRNAMHPPAGDQETAPVAQPAPKKEKVGSPR